MLVGASMVCAAVGVLAEVASGPGGTTPIVVPFCLVACIAMRCSRSLAELHAILRQAPVGSMDHPSLVVHLSADMVADKPRPSEYKGKGGRRIEGGGFKKQGKKGKKKGKQKRRKGQQKVI